MFWEGGVNRSDITERFGVSVPQASGDLALYRELAPENLVYDSTAKRYVPQAAFQPRFLKPNPDRYLAQLKGLADGILAMGDTWIASLLPTDVLPVPSRRIDAGILRALLIAVRERRAIEIHYQSMSREHPEALWRWITPHAFGFDGLRWHTRAFCHRNKEFLDFVLGRCLATGDTQTPEARAEDDWQWQKVFEVELEPNPELTEGQRRAIALDYGMTDWKVTVRVRFALLYYFTKRLRLDLGPAFDAPHERPVRVANRKQFNAALSTVAARPRKPAIA